jgi:hypothetical protein
LRITLEKIDGIYDVKMMRADLQATMIHSRKLRLKAIVEMVLEQRKKGLRNRVVYNGMADK